MQAILEAPVGCSLHLLQNVLRGHAQAYPVALLQQNGGVPLHALIVDEGAIGRGIRDIPAHLTLQWR